MKILVTGSNGFVGRNLILQLKARGHIILAYDKNNKVDELDDLLRQADFLVHLAGVNRPEKVEEFYTGNADLTSIIVNKIISLKLALPLIFTSSIQASLNNDYGKSKNQAETVLLEYSRVSNNKVYIYRLPNLFGKWSRPNYNSVVATFCYNITRQIPLTISEANPLLNLAYIDDVVLSFINTIENGFDNNFVNVKPTYQVSLRDIAGTLQDFYESRTKLYLPITGNEFVNKLYATYLSYLPTEEFAYDIKTHKDNRGSFTELFKTPDFGQVSVNVARPGIIKGNHYHHTKNEKFVVVKGQAVLRFRQVGSSEIISYNLNGDNIQIVDIPPGYIHHIENTGNEDMVFIIWANETFNEIQPDTVFEQL